jgi:hypothetical protein
MYAPAFGVDIAHLQSQTFTETQIQTTEDEKEEPVTEGAGRQKQTLGFLNSDIILQTLGFGRLDQMGRHSGFAQHMGIIELEAVHIEFD